MSVTIDRIDITGYSNDQVDRNKFTRTTHTIDEFEHWINALPLNYSVFILLLNPSNEIINRIDRIKAIKPSQFYDVIYHSYEHNNQRNPFYLCFTSTSPKAILYKIRSDIIQYLDQSSLTLHERGSENLSLSLRSASNSLAKSLKSIPKVKGCHVLLIPYNVSRISFNAAYAYIRNMISDLLLQHQITVHTLSQYVGGSENSSFGALYENDLRTLYNGNFIKTIQKLSMIRIYIVGKEPPGPNDWSINLALHDLIIHHTEGINVNFADPCTFVAAPGIRPESIGDLRQRFSGLLQSDAIIPKDFNMFETVQVRGDFLNALEFARDRLPFRELQINVQLAQQLRVNGQNIPRPIQSGDEAQDDSRISDVAHDVNV